MCGSKSNTTTTTSAPSAAAMGAYQNLLSGAQTTFNQNPFQTYGGEFVAPVNPQQYSGVSGINQYANAAQPGYGMAEWLAANAASPIGAGQILQYQNPYTQNVVNATEAQFANTNAQQQQQVLGNAAVQGALGGDRAGIAQAVLAGQQQLQEAPVIANLENQSYVQAVQTALAEQQAQAQGAYGVGALAGAAQTAGLQGAGAQVQAGTLEQQTQQAQNEALYRQFLMQQAFPYQQMQWLAGIDTGVGSQMGGTSSTTGPPPSLLSQLGGLGLAGVGILGGTGGFGPSGYLTKMFDAGGRIEADGLANGGVPALIGQPLYGGVSGVLPQNQITRGQGPPHPPGVATQSQAPQMIADAQKFAQAMKGHWYTPDTPTGVPGGGVGGQGGGLTPDISEEARGGYVRQHGFDSGGPITAAGFGTGSLMPRHYQEGGFATPSEEDRQRGLDALKLYMPPASVPVATPDQPVVLPDGTVDHGTITLLPDQIPGGSTPEQLRSRRISDDVVLTASGVSPSSELPPEIMAGTSHPASNSALAYDEPSRRGVASPSVADQIIDRYRNGLPPATVPQASGAAAPWSSPQSNIWPSLMAAGFGMMASRSPFPGVAIGEGGMQGVKTYEGLSQQQRAEAMSQQKINMAADNLMLHADQEQKRMADEAKKLQYMGWTIKPDNTMVATPGGPHDPAVIRQQSEAKGENWKQTFDPTTGQILWFNTKTMETRDQQGKPVTPPSGATPSVPAPNAPSVPVAPGTPTSQQPALPSSPTQVGNAPEGPIKVASTDPNLVGIVRANAAQAAQPYNYGKDAPYIEKGMEVPEPQSVGGKSTAAIKQAGEYFLQTGKLPAGFSIPRGNNPVAVTQALAGNSAINYANALSASRGMTPEQVAEAWRTAPGMLRFILGPDGRSTVALGTSVRHLDTTAELVKAWQEAANTGNFQTLNRIKASVAREFGNAAVTNLDAARQIVGPEIIKAIGVAGAGTEAERKAAAAFAAPWAGPDQALGAITTVQKLLGGQLEGRERQATNAGVSHDRFKSLIGDRPYELLTHIDRGGAATTPATPEVPPGSRKQNGWWYDPSGKPLMPAQ